MIGGVGMESTVSEKNRESEIITERESVSYIFKEGTRPKDAEYSDVIVAKGGNYGEITE